MATDLARFRKDLHQIPEPGLAEFNTKEYIINAVKHLGCTIHEVGDTGLVLYFDNHQEVTIGFRADMDALPLEEATGLDFASKNSGFMHACGHDGHMAILLGLAEYIHLNRTGLDKNVVLVFQPSEEKEAGANIISGSGLLEHYQVSALYGLHLWPGLKPGEIYTIKGPMMAAGSETDIIIRGKSAHVGSAHEGIDALEIACRYLADLYELEASYPIIHRRLLKFGALNSGSARNIIADTAHLSGTLRSYDSETHAWFKAHIKQIAQDYADEFDCTFEISYFDGYEALINDEMLFEAVRQAVPGIRQLPAPVMQSEDFGIYKKNCPILFAFLGLGNTAPLHHPAFDFEMGLMDAGLDYFIQILGMPSPKNL
ncbi:MAG: M20 family metallopeptidase [Turicibacter sp.]|nr:M20 family metallopeptidase [Turicibacter sp.]